MLTFTNFILFMIMRSFLFLLVIKEIASCYLGSWNLVLTLEINKMHLFPVADIAFVDRADIKAYVGPPTLQARYEILRSCLEELLRTGILSYSQMQVCIKSNFCRITVNLEFSFSYFTTRFGPDISRCSVSIPCPYSLMLYIRH